MQTMESYSDPEMLSSLPALFAEARSGDPSAREELLRQYIPLVVSVASRVRGRFVQIGRDPEIGLGLVALNSAIDGYRPERGSFMTFATMIIKRRLIDYDRSQKKQIEWTSSDLAIDDVRGNNYSRTIARQAMEQQRLTEETDDRREEIRLYTQRLQEFGIAFKDLEAQSPKHAAARRRIIACTLALVRNHSLAEQLLRTKRLPLKELIDLVPIGRKTVERNRRYIIAVALIFLGRFEFLRNHLVPYVN